MNMPENKYYRAIVWICLIYLSCLVLKGITVAFNSVGQKIEDLNWMQNALITIAIFIVIGFFVNQNEKSDKNK